MTKKNQHHVVPHDGEWAVKKAGAKKASVVLPTKKEALDAGRKISQNQGTELVSHKKDGTIQGSDSHGKDPNPPKDNT